VAREHAVGAMISAEFVVETMPVTVELQANDDRKPADSGIGARHTLTNDTTTNLFEKSVNANKQITVLRTNRSVQPLDQVPEYQQQLYGVTSSAKRHAYPKTMDRSRPENSLLMTVSTT